MSSNSSSSSGPPPPPPPPPPAPFNASSGHQPYYCFNFPASVFIAASFTATKAVVLLPLCVLVLRLALRRRRRRSHSDVFCYHLMCVELVSVSGWTLFCCGTHRGVQAIVLPGYYLMLLSFPGQMFFHCLTCVERYLAVVHPVAYMSLRSGGGARVRDLGAAGVWLLCAGWVGVVPLYYPALPSTPLFCLVAFSVAVVSSCSLSAVCALVRPGPGAGGGGRPDRSKRRAVVAVVAITAVLFLYFVGLVLCVALRVSSLLSYRDGCVATVCSVWFSLPSSLLLPLLLLHRAA